MIKSKFRFLLPKSFVLLLALTCSTTSFGAELDISDIEKALSSDLEGEQSTVIDSELSTSQSEEKKTTESKKVPSSAVYTEQPNKIPADSSSNNNSLKQAESLPQADKGKLIILNKITTKSTEHILKIGEVKFFGNLSIKLHKCVKGTDPYNVNNWMLLTIFDNKVKKETLTVFHGWVLSSNPSLSTLEHPVYEVIPLDCIVSSKK
ncbi:MAG: DUF2155 domain-containing protein [Rickettsiaceae bacterium]|nr:DUF2155 domain-containing protein [Rickettsiaceae bacterium]